MLTKGDNIMQNAALTDVETISSGGNPYEEIWKNKYPEGQKWDVQVESAPLTRLLDEAAVEFANSPAIDFGEVKLSYSELDALVSKVAKGLQSLGVNKGVKVGLFLPNTHYSIAFYFGILGAGGTVVNYNPLYVERELESQIEDSETKILVTLNSESTMTKAENVLRDTSLERIIICPLGDGVEVAEDDSHILYNSVIDNDGGFEAVAINPEEDIAVLQYTGGTTGVPKGAMLTHANIYSNIMQTSLWFGDLMKPGNSSVVCVLPLFHVFSMTVVMNLSVHLGVEMIIVSQFEPVSFVNLLNEKKPSFLPAVPAIFNALAYHPAAEGLDLSYIKFCMSGGAPLPGDVKQAFEARTGAKLGEGYGLTEISPVGTCNPLQGGDIKIGSVGLPIPGTLVEIVDMENGETILPVGEKGEVCFTGPQVMKGYYQKPEATAETIRNGRLHTGDVGYIDEEGYLYLVDRLKDLIIVRGYNVYPTQVEEAVYMHPSVAECIVAGVPDAERGETVWAWVKAKEGESVEEAELIEFLKDKISPIELPRKVIVRDEPLPKTAVGKLSRKLLLEEEGLR
jgi:long-chain acyl-CoA synthetase